MPRTSTDPYTDRQRLVTAAYGNSANLTARADIYSYQQPSIDLATCVLNYVEWRGDEQDPDSRAGAALHRQHPLPS